MPYIDRMAKQEIDEGREPLTPGELNYRITTVLMDYLERKGHKYTFINDCLGALEGAKLEFYRRVAAPYEDKKRLENGDVYTKSEWYDCVYCDATGLSNYPGPDPKCGMCKGKGRLEREICF